MTPTLRCVQCSLLFVGRLSGKSATYIGSPELGLHQQWSARLVKSDSHTGPQALTHGQHVPEILHIEGDI